MYLKFQRELFSTHEDNRQTWRLRLYNYLIDPKNIYLNESTKNNTKIKFNLSSDEHLAQERFKNDISILNFFFDTPTITQISLEMRVNTFDKLSMIGGTLGLYTGISIITLIEMVWWLIKFGIYVFRRQLKNAKKKMLDTSKNDATSSKT